MLSPTCHLLLPEPWAHVPKETREHRDLLVVTELPLSASLPLHCAIWCMALITAHCQACFSPMYGEKKPTLTAKKLNIPPSAFVICVRQVKFCFSCEHGAGDRGQRMQSVSYSQSVNGLRQKHPFYSFSKYEWKVVKLSTFKSALLDL